MTVAICDDEPYFIEQLSEMLHAYCQKMALSCQIKCFASGEELIETEEKFNLIFLDINMKKLTGIETAAILRKRDPNFILVFISAFMEYAPQGYEVNAFRYLLKNDLRGSFLSCMKAVTHRMGDRKSVV